MQCPDDSPHPDGDSRRQSFASDQPPVLSVEAYFDLICPWCLIGKRHLETAIDGLGRERPDVAVQVTWRSYPLIPTTPPAGLPYRQFYLARLGSPAAVAMRQAQVCAAAKEAGLTLALDRIETFPNTLLAHRLVAHARQQAGAGVAALLIDELFQRYFIRAENIGDPQVLRQAAASCGLALPERGDSAAGQDLDWLASLPGPLEPPARAGLGVPCFVFNGTHSVSGARPPEVLLQTMHRALARARQRATLAAG
ncbi:DsbA family oxidoreductase [Cupriavidus taiwanensis]|uniref:DsbA family oxidoreductase n=1 Tax=Cupriavidus taiwanensis TaxID=164546 RepID=UPI000E10A723|nr:DsbA family oxidoreductase [Cupriavidus taiwanensis]SOY42677.1 putative thioredoxin, DSBA oxidoreductase family [Cupriavidus taiwanensis]SOY44820.1 putative thioredoxin, DSBA oxidoreductase family [Cupriavidus taiwanensis]SOY80685.1 putative thioredoxin, DSBA oxidoreductase family [Cupriavidus taiwanensis]SOZ52441.1 putative thioredoxin, DSBA oxidoreductase family [Cupriavidus taiwanensis]SOZ77044.1 putative thioredoxin, DSBA oxidoreductase family [Cupriavidus taiwanensis]